MKPKVDPGVAVEPTATVVSAAMGKQGASCMMDTLRATGVPFGVALGQMAVLFGTDTAQGAWDQFLDDPTLKGYRAIAVLDDLAASDPVLANALLNDACATGRMPEWADEGGALGIFLHDVPWLTSLSGDCTFEGCLSLSESTELASLPDRLRTGNFVDVSQCGKLVQLPRSAHIGGDLVLSGTAFVQLPGDLVVMGDLFLAGCPAWDGHIPDGATVRGWVYTDDSPQGIGLDAWRGRARQDG